MTDSNKDTVGAGVPRYYVNLEKSYREEPEPLTQDQKIHKGIDLLKTWRSIYSDLETVPAFRPLFAVIDALQEDQFDS